MCFSIQAARFLWPTIFKMGSLFPVKASSTMFNFSNVLTNSTMGAREEEKELIKNKGIVQRTRDALGDVGNRLKKKPAVPQRFSTKIYNTQAKPGIPVDCSTQTVPNPEPQTETGVCNGDNATSLRTQQNVTALQRKTSDHQIDLQTNRSTFHTFLPSKNIGDVVENTIPEVILSVTPNPESEKQNTKEATNIYNPELNIENVRANGFSRYVLNSHIVDIDVNDTNPELVQVYAKDIYNYVFSLEKKYIINEKYLEGRLINSRMRAVLLDWLIEVHYQYAFVPETLYLCAKILDRYLQVENKVTRKHLQLVGVTALYLAAKYEEVSIPSMQQFSATADNAFTSRDLKRMEEAVLRAINFDLGCPPSMLFLRRFAKAANVNMSTYCIAKYIMELSIVDYAACHLLPSEQAAGSLGLALLITSHKSLLDVWNSNIQHYTRKSLESIRPIVCTLAGILSRARKDTKLKAVHHKYAHRSMGYASKAPEFQGEAWKCGVFQRMSWDSQLQTTDLWKRFM